ncbi:DUF1853 family protein [Leeuwenhoekiella sp. NPDC079379]|uniref:DUF1853 family protein n=1 Tax=Leeuwenhoekiella sp. NPDC079379 TaxID=3364122 RepID=UPI0037C9AC9A
MKPEPKKLQLQYTGFLNTEQLIFAPFEFPFLNFQLKNFSDTLPDDFVMPQNIRLGQRMEVFMSAALKNEHYTIRAKNLQIIANKRTLGELDFILEDHKEKKLIHLEMVYKFYFYRPEIEGDWRAKLIGPNAKDQLIFKLNKLSQHQFPILKNRNTQLYLKDLRLLDRYIEQQIYFKAQIFVPFKFTTDQVISKFQNCVAGIYFRREQLDFFLNSEYTYYIPPKNDWVSKPSEFEEFLPYRSFYKKISAALEEQRSCMFWVKDCNTKVCKRHFATWW